MLKLSAMQCLHITEPVGIDETPYFSWRLNSSGKDVMQTAYHIVVMDESEKIMWNSGRIQTDQSVYVLYDGEALQSKTKYKWQVTVWDNQGGEASETSWFETGFLKIEDWKAKWIKSPFPVFERQAHLGEQPCAVLFRQEMQISGKVKRARLYATCHGVYQLTVNGKRANDREFAPEFTVYRDYLCYQIYDVTKLLKSGENVVGMHVGDGWYHGFMTVVKDESYDPEHAVLFQMEVVYEDGREEIFCSDESMRVQESPVRCSDLFAGERYDANQMPYGWDTADFSAKTWEKGVCEDFGYRNLKAEYEQPVRPVKILPVKEILHAPNGDRIIDFGQVIAGRVRVHLNLPKDRQMTIYHTEGLDEKGNFFDNNPTADQRIEYISDGKEQIYEPHFTFQGFRYILVKGIDELKKEDFQAVVLSTEKEDRGSFSCSDRDVTRLYENTRWSQCANMLSIPTDCPQREKAGWCGDIQVYTPTAIQNEEMTPFLNRWLKNLSLEQKENGSVPFVIPLAGSYVGMYHEYEKQFSSKDAVSPAGWADAAVLIPYYMYQLTGNTVILKQQYESMKKWCNFVLETARTRKPDDSILPDEIERYLWNTGHHYGEHLIPSYSKAGYGEATFEAIRVSTKYVAPIYSYYSLCCLTEVAEVLGFREDSAYYKEMSEKVKEAFFKGIIDKEGNMPAELMGAYAMPIYYGLVPEKFAKHFADKLVKSLQDNGGCLDTGFLGTPVLLDALCKIGRRDLAYDLLFQEKAPSWLYEVKHGATTIWESWFALAEDGTPFRSQVYGWDFTMSLNHYAFGCIDDWMFRNINGIDKITPGFKEILIQPQPDSRLTWAKRTFTCEYGDIVSEWEKQEKEFVLYVEIPCNTKAVIILPDGSRHERGSGKYRFSCEISDKF